jgi:hypothetical protein
MIKKRRIVWEVVPAEGGGCGRKHNETIAGGVIEQN